MKALERESEDRSRHFGRKKKTCQNLIRKDQEEQLEAILARQRKEISEHRAATDQILRQAEEQALKFKDDLLIREKDA